MAKPLPNRFNPDLMARDGARYEAALPLSSFERLTTLLQDSAGEVHVSAAFARRERHILISGRLTVRYSLQCQRCLAPMTLVVDEPYELVFVPDSASAEALPDELDPVVLDDGGYMATTVLFEDELILHVPLIARHADIADCAPLPDNVAAVVPEDDDAAPRRNPFDALKNLDLH